MDTRRRHEELWSLVDRGDAALDAHLARHPEDRAALDEMRELMGLARRVADTQPQLSPTRIASYRIEREIGRGGCGVVYEAWQERPERRVALKVLRQIDLGESSARERFEREAQALGRLSHPHIATIYEAGRALDGLPFLAMELVHGPTLGEFVRERALDLRARVGLVRDVCDAVHYAHRQGVIHRDLKPGNVLVDREHGVKVVDFGLARLHDSGGATTETGVVIGTLAYMSPEQARGERERIDERADVYSLGAILYELIVGAPPFDLRGLNALEAVQRVAHERPRAPSTRVEKLDRDLEAIVLQALEKEPEQRYSSAAALAEDLAAWLAGRAVLARRPTRIHRLRKLAARNRTLTALVLLLVALLLALTFSATWRNALMKSTGTWWGEAAAFDAVHWIGDRPQVELDGRTWDLLEIDGLHVDFITGVCKQHWGPLWRMRFCEDLRLVLNMSGDWAVFDVDVVLRDPDSGEIRERRGVPLERAQATRAVLHRATWPFAWIPGTASSVRVKFQDREWELVGVAGVHLDSLTPAQRSAAPLFLYDLLTERAGRSPGARVRFELRDLATGETREFEDIERAPALRRARSSDER